MPCVEVPRSLEDIELGERLTFYVGSDDVPAIKVGTPWMRSLVPSSRLVEVQGGHSFKSEAKHLAAILVELRERAKQAPAEGAGHPAVANLMSELGLGGERGAAATTQGGMSTGGDGGEKPWWKF